MMKTQHGKRKRHGRHTGRRRRPSHRDLFPMPKCACTTRLVASSRDLPSVVFSSSSSGKGEEDDDDCSIGGGGSGGDNDHRQHRHPLEVMSRIETHSFPNLAICRSCLERRIAASKEVTVHDYRQEHIPNGQRNVKFTVEPDCVQCKRKFMVRMLERLLDSEGGGHPSSNSGGKSDRRKKGKPDANWQDAVEATIRLVGWAKRNIRRGRARRRRKAPGETGQRGEFHRTEQYHCWWEKHGGFSGGDDNCSSDDCYSLSSDSGDGWQSDDDDDDDVRRPTKGPRRVELKSGELMEELLQKDPKFRQEREDEQYVKKMMKDAMDEEEERQRREERRVREMVERMEEKERVQREKAAMARAREDHEFAMKLQEEEDKKKENRFQPMKTRSRSPLFAAFKKTSSAEKNERKQKSVDIAGGGDSPASSTPSSCSKASSAMISSTALPYSSTPKKKPENVTASPEPKNLEQSQSQKSSFIAKTPNKDTVSNEDAVGEIMAMGFSEASACHCLKDANGNVQLAMSMLLSEASDS